LQKGVALSHRAIFNHLDAYGEAIRLTREDVIISWLPLYHDMGLIACFLMPILRGVPVCRCPRLTGFGRPIACCKPSQPIAAR